VGLCGEGREADPSDGTADEANPVEAGNEGPKEQESREQGSGGVVTAVNSPTPPGRKGALSMSDPFGLLRSPYLFLILGIISILAAVVFTRTGKTWVRFHGWVYRVKEPKWFWWEIALYYLCGIGLIGYFLYLVN
jgi:hypothetical protein